MVLLMNGEECKKQGCSPMAKIVSHAQCGVDPKIMGTGPIPAVLKTVSVNEDQYLLLELLMKNFSDRKSWLDPG